MAKAGMAGTLRRDRDSVTVYVLCRMYREDDLFVSECLTLPVTTQGETEAQTIGNMVEALQLFIRACIEKDTLEVVLRKYHWRPIVEPMEVPRGETLIPVPVSLLVKQRLDECRT